MPCHLECTWQSPACGSRRAAWGPGVQTAGLSSSLRASVLGTDCGFMCSCWGSRPTPGWTVHTAGPPSQRESPTLRRELLPHRHSGLLWTRHQLSLFPSPWRPDPWPLTRHLWCRPCLKHPGTCPSPDRPRQPRPLSPGPLTKPPKLT